MRQPKMQAEQQQYTFRRSRTITGTTTSDIVAAGEGRAQLKSPRVKEHDLRRHRRRLSTYLFVCLVVIAGLVYVISQFLGTVGSVYASQFPAKDQSSLEPYQQNANRFLATHPLQHFNFSLSEDQLTQHIRVSQPEVERATIVPRGHFLESELKLTFRKPIASWTINGERYYVDKDGVAFTTSFFAEPRITISDNSGVSAETGVLASTKLLHFIARVVTLIEQADIAQVARVELPANSTRQVDLWLKDKPYYVKVQSDRDPAGQAADVVSAVRFMNEFAIKPKYIDVRVESKAFYRD